MIKIIEKFAILLVSASFFMVACNKDDEISKGKDSTCTAGVNAITFKHNGENREYLLYKPDNLLANAPLVFVLHGSTQNAQTYYDLGFNQVADTAKFLVCYPQGLKCFWEKDAHNTNDVGFLKALAQFLQTEHILSETQTFVTGFSAGGAMSLLLGLDASDTFKAIASVAGGTNDVVWNDKNPQYAIPVFVIHGTDDQIVPINGVGGKGNFPPTQDVVDYFKTLNNCTTTETVQFTTYTTAYYYRDGINNNEVWFYKIVSQDHIFTGDPDPKAAVDDVSGFNGCIEIWRFFRKW